MNDVTLALGYFGGYVNLALALPRILTRYRPRKVDGKWRVEGVQAVTFSPAPDSSGAQNHAMLRKFGNDLMGQHVISHTRDTDGQLRYTFRVFVPGNRARWARDLLAYNGCEVEGMSGEIQNARAAHGLPRAWADGPGWAGARKTERQPKRAKRQPTGLERVARLFEE